jgi:hypothetical protein
LEKTLISDLRARVDEVRQKFTALELCFERACDDLQPDNRFRNPETIPTIETLISKSIHLSSFPSADPPDFLVIECHCEEDILRNANPWAFIECLKKVFKVPHDRIISVEICLGSVVAKALCSFDMNFLNIREFSDQFEQTWYAEIIHQFKATRAIEKLINDIKQNSESLFLNYHNEKLFFLLSEPQILPLNTVHTRW